MLFCDRLSDDVWANAPNHQRKHQLRGIMKDFALSFAPISFRLELNFNLINAQAVTTVCRTSCEHLRRIGLPPETRS